MLNWGMDWDMGMKKLKARFVDIIKEPGKYYDANDLFLRVFKKLRCSYCKYLSTIPSPIIAKASIKTLMNKSVQ